MINIRLLILWLVKIINRRWRKMNNNIRRKMVSNNMRLMDWFKLLNKYISNSNMI